MPWLWAARPGTQAPLQGAPQTRRRGCEAQLSRRLMTLGLFREARGHDGARALGCCDCSGSFLVVQGSLSDSSPAGRVVREGVFTEISTLLKTFYFLIFLFLPITYISHICASSSLL